MPLDRAQFRDQGYLIRRNVIPPDKIDELRASYERMVDRQRAIWARDRQPNDPAGGVWETAAQPRLIINHTTELIDEQTASAAEFWLHENVRGVSAELLGDPEAALTEMFLMCNPVRDHGPAGWHRDTSPGAASPFEAVVEDLAANGPHYVQWNIPLYDDDVLWIVPRSHQRINTDEENRIMRENPRLPLPGGMRVDLKAGDGVVYINMMLHWGSNYSTRLRRTIHGGYASQRGYSGDTSFIRYLSPPSQTIYARWRERATQQHERTERIYRALIRQDVAAVRAALAELHPGEAGRMRTIIQLSKFAQRLYRLRQPEIASLPPLERSRATGAGSIYRLDGLERSAVGYSEADANALWRCFAALDAKLQADEEQFVPGYQSGPTRYVFEKMPPNVGVEEFIASWA